MKKLFENTIVTTITLPNGSANRTIYDPSTSSVEIISKSTSSSGVVLEPQYREEITETFERSRGLLDGGIKISFKLPEFLGGAELSFERRSKEETKKITREIFGPKK
jgi:hypothetical protein